ncbi:MAG: hypothetical protein CVU05_03220 [Bacteroidetes bacterium HGW-Bacteroidetes-21]|jgi:tetratricopeptide (TPR) repeat protein|nr:MAG: hypothetical protein CVU05_03220 [Bacteroidetes bacterium HGW-Bacteroidetes-21]
MTETKNGNEAIILLDSIPDSSENKVERDYFSGLICMGLDKYTQAVKYFNSVAQSQELLYVEDAIWQLGLCYLKLNDILAAKQEFEKLQNASAYYQKKVLAMMALME